MTKLAKSTKGRSNIDIRYGIIHNGVYMHDHTNSQTNTPDKARGFFYDSNGRSSSAIYNMPYSNVALRSIVIITVNGVATRGFSVYGAGVGNYPFRILKISYN